MTDTIMGTARDAIITGYAVGAGTLVLVEQLTTWFSLLSVVLGTIGAIYTIIHQRAKLINARNDTAADSERRGPRRRSLPD